MDSRLPPTACAPSSSTGGSDIRAVFRKAFSFPVLLGTLLVAAAFAATSWEGNASGTKIFVEDDTWWHLETGQRVLKTHTWPTTEPYSFTAPGSSWIAYEWLGEVLMAFANREGGFQGMAILLIGLAGILVLALYHLAYLRSRNSKAAAAACALTLPVLASFFNLRPQLLGYIFLLFTLTCLELFRQGRGKAVWVLPALFVLWVNAHGTFVLGLGILGLYWASGLVNFRLAGVAAIPWSAEQRRRLLVIILLCVVALPLSPYGSRLAANPLDIALNRPLSLANNTEWNSIASFGVLPVKLFLVLALLFLLAYAVLSPAVYRIEEIVLLFLAIYQGSFQVRFLLFFSVVFTPLLAVMLARWVPPYQPQKDKYALNVVIMAAVLGGLALHFPSDRDLRSMLQRKVPQGAVGFLHQHPDIGPVFNESVWGGYLIWSGRRVFMDGRLDAYEPSGALLDYLSITGLDRNALFLLQKYGVKACLLKRDSPLGTFFRVLPDWKEVYSDTLSTVFVRTTGAAKYPLATNPGPGARTVVNHEPPAR